MSSGKRLLSEVESHDVTAFQRSFFPNLAEIQATSKSELIQKAKRLGIPTECAIAYWRFKNKSERASKREACI